MPKRTEEEWYWIRAWEDFASGFMRPTPTSVQEWDEFTVWFHARVEPKRYIEIPSLHQGQRVFTRADGVVEHFVWTMP